MAQGISTQQSMGDSSQSRTSGSIIQMSLDGSVVYSLPLTDHIPVNPTAVAYDASTKLVFWVDQKAATINRARLDGSEEKVILELPRCKTNLTFES